MRKNGYAQRPITMIAETNVLSSKRRDCDKRAASRMHKKNPICLAMPQRRKQMGWKPINQSFYAILIS